MEAFVRVQRSTLEVGFLREATFPRCFFKVPIFLDRKGCFPERYCSNVLPFIMWFVNAFKTQSRKRDPPKLPRAFKNRCVA